MKITPLIILVLSITLTNTLGQTKKDSLYVFIGKKISVEQFNPNTDRNIIYMDNAFKANYKVVENIFGTYQKDTIEFEAYDHYGTPEFSKYKYVLLFVSNYNGKLYHEKYQFADVYRTTSGRWASSYKTSDYKNVYNKNTRIKPEKIEFTQNVSYSIKGNTLEQITERFPMPYYQIIKDSAVAVFGNYVEDLFELKKGGVLKARGIF